MLAKVRRIVEKELKGLLVAVFVLCVLGSLIFGSHAAVFMAIVSILLILVAIGNLSPSVHHVGRRRRVVVPYAQYRYLSRLHTETVKYVPPRAVRWRHHMHKARSTTSRLVLSMLVMLPIALPVGLAAVWLAGITRADWIAFTSDIPPNKLIIKPMPTEGCGLVPCHYEPVYQRQGEQTVVEWKRVDD